MKSEQPQQSLSIDFIVNKCHNIATKKGIQLAQTFFSLAKTRCLDRMFKEYSKNFNQFGVRKADKYLQQAFISAINNMKTATTKEEGGKQKNKQSQKELKAKKQQQVLHIKKEREEQSEQKIMSQWRSEMSSFYQSQIRKKQKETSILKTAKMIKQKLISVSKNYLPINSEALRNMTSLKIISIQYTKYELKRKNIFEVYVQQGCYSISAFELFKLINNNRKLTEVTLKGVAVQSLQQLLSSLKSSKRKNRQKEETQNKDQLIWMRDFSPSKTLKLSIDAQIVFQFTNKSKVLSYYSNLKLFLGLFYQISDITVKIFLEYSKPFEWGSIVQDILKQLKAIRRIKIQIQGSWRVGEQSCSTIRSVLFGGLTSFTSIAQIHFINIEIFKKGKPINDGLAIEQSLRTIFENNQITCLKILNCHNFPRIDSAISLKQIHVRNSSFKRRYDSINDLIGNNPKLISIHCKRIDDDTCKISESLFNKLELLIIDRNYYFDFASPQKTSKIKYLSLQGSARIRADCLSKIFPKLLNLCYLHLKDIDFSNEIVTIPSPYLEEVHIFKNSTINNQAIQAVDLKWPFIKYLSLCDCRQITQSVWSSCRFKELIELTINRMEVQSKKVVHDLRKRGVKVNYDY